MERAKISGKSPAISAVVYDKLSGVDFSTDPGLIALERSPFAPNLMSGPGGYPEKRPGWRTLRTMGAPVYGMFAGKISGETVYLLHCGSVIYRWYPYGTAAPVSLYTGVKQSFSRAFAHAERIYILTGGQYLVCGMFDGSLKIKTVQSIAKIPETMISCSFSGGGTTLEAPNLLTQKRKVGYLVSSDKNRGIVKLPEKNIGGTGFIIELRNQTTGEWNELAYTSVGTLSAKNEAELKKEHDEYLEDGGKRSFEDWMSTSVYIKIGDVYWPGEEKVEGVINVNTEEGVLRLSQDITLALWDASGSGMDNLRITYLKTAEDGADDLSRCTICTFFENRVFLAGHPDKPDYDWHSGADDPTYFPDTGYARVGAGGGEIMGYLPVGSAQAIVKAESQQDASIYLRTATTMNGEPEFSLRQGVSGQGAVAKRAFSNILDDPLFLTRNGVFAVTSNLVTEERTLANRSRFLDPRLTRETHLADAVACNWNGMYLLSMTDGAVYLLDGKQNKVYLENSLTGAGYNYEAYHWTNMPATVWMPEGKDLFFGTADGRLCRLNTDIEGVEKYNDDGNAIRACRATRVEFCGDFLRYKTMVKKGSGLLMQPYSRSSVKVYVRTDRAKAQKFFMGALDDYDWQGDELGSDFTAWEGAQVVPFKKKVKKWKWIQIIVENNEVNEGFGVYGIIVRHQKQNLV